MEKLVAAVRGAGVAAAAASAWNAARSTVAIASVFRTLRFGCGAAGESMVAFGSNGAAADALEARAPGASMVAFGSNAAIGASSVAFGSVETRMGPSTVWLGSSA